MPLSVMTSTSTVGLPRESRISMALTPMISDMGSASYHERRKRGKAPVEGLPACAGVGALLPFRGGSGLPACSRKGPPRSRGAFGASAGRLAAWLQGVVRGARSESPMKLDELGAGAQTELAQRALRQA